MRQIAKKQLEFCIMQNTAVSFREELENYQESTYNILSLKSSRESSARKLSRPRTRQVDSRATKKIARIWSNWPCL